MKKIIPILILAITLTACSPRYHESNSYPHPTPISCNIRYEVTGSIGDIIFTETAYLIEYIDGDGEYVFLQNVDLPWTYSTTMEYIPSDSIYHILDTKVYLSADADSSAAIAAGGYIKVEIYKDNFLWGVDSDSDNYSIHASVEGNLESTFAD